MAFARELVIGVVYPEDNWHHELDGDGETTGNLIIDDLDYLKTVDFYWLTKNFISGSSKVLPTYSWESVSVPEPLMMEYVEKCGDGDSSVKYDGIMFFNESNKSFSRWYECLIDMTHHIAFNHTYCDSYYNGGSHRRFMGIAPFRLICEPYIAHMVRRNSNAINDLEADEFDFGKVYDLGMMKNLVEKFGPVG